LLHFEQLQCEIFLTVADFQVITVCDRNHSL